MAEFASSVGKYRDWFRIKDILEVAGISLDDDDYSHTGSTYRYSGVTINMNIHYMHDSRGDLSKCTYSFTPLPIEAFYSQTESHKFDDEGKLVSMLSSVRKGVRIRMTVSGFS